jgi:hypothetical protein
MAKNSVTTLAMTVKVKFSLTTYNRTTVTMIAGKEIISAKIVAAVIILVVEVLGWLPLAAASFNLSTTLFQNLSLL